MAAYCSDRGYAMYFLGAQPGLAQRAADILVNRLPGLKIAGVHHGYFTKNPASYENKAVLNGINNSGADILIVGFGMPMQEKWLAQSLDAITVNATMTGGAVFDYVSGALNRAPYWMTDHGFEWLGRLLIEPRRLWRRYLIGNPLFLYRVIRQRCGLIDFNREMH